MMLVLIGPEEKKTSSIAKDVVRDNKNFMCYHLSLFPALILFPASGCCYSKVMEDKHRCVEGAMHHNCPVCFEVKRIISANFSFTNAT